MGRTTCTDGAWSECVGNRIVTQSLPGVTLSAGGISTQSTNVACSNPCDPNGCQATLNGPNDVDASGVAPTDGGLGLVLGGGGACTGLKCYVASCGGHPENTTISGIVFDPAGRSPLYNISVYVPNDATGALPAFSAGAQKDQCGSSNVAAVTKTTTGPDGSFVLTGVPSGVDVPLVVQSGKWRREIIIKSSAITPCGNNSVTTSSCKSGIAASDCTLRLPKKQNDGWNWNTSAWGYADIPRHAIITGKLDPFECLVLKTGVDPSEFTSYDHTSITPHPKFDIFEDPDRPGTVLDPSSPVAAGNRIEGNVLWNELTPTGKPKATLLDYDAVIIPCVGSPIDVMQHSATSSHRTSVLPPAGTNPYAKLINYTNNGGRAYLTHFSYSWLLYPSALSYVTGDNWGTVATWAHKVSGGVMNGSSYATNDPLPTTILQSTQLGADFASWLVNVGASQSLGSLDVHEGRHDTTDVGDTNTPSATLPWALADESRSGVTPTAYNPLFSFNTPYPNAPANQYGKVIYSDFHVTAGAIDSTPGGSCQTNADCGFAMTCIGAGATGTPGTCSEKCSTSNDCKDNSYTCSGGTAGTCRMKSCEKNKDCGENGGGVCVSGKCQCTTDAHCRGNGDTTSTCNVATGQCVKGAWTCTKSNQCGRVEQCKGSDNQNGTCSKTCTTATTGPSSECPGGEFCVGGLCKGCYSKNQCYSNINDGASCSGGTPPTAGTCKVTANNAYSVTTPSGTLGTFPFACANTTMTSQEKALEFLFFNLTACVDAGTPVAPATYSPATFTQDFSATCTPGNLVKWREFDWQATIPSSASIVFQAQSGPTTSSLLPASPLTLATATASTAAPAWSIAFIDTSNATGAGGTAPFNTASPPVASSSVLRMTLTMSPTTDKLQTPVISQWKAQYDCIPAE